MTKIMCPACPRRTELKKNGDRLTCGCHMALPLVQQRSEEDSNGKKTTKVTGAVDETMILEGGFVEVKPHINLTRTGRSPRVYKNVGDGTVGIDFIVVYENTFVSGDAYCPNCGSFQGSLQLLSGSFSPRPCTQSLRAENDGYNVRFCRHKTKFIVHNEFAGPGILATTMGSR